MFSGTEVYHRWQWNAYCFSQTFGFFSDRNWMNRLLYRVPNTSFRIRLWYKPTHSRLRFVCFITEQIVLVYKHFPHQPIFWCIYEPWYDKTNNVAVRPTMTQISLGIPVWSGSSLSTWRNLGSLVTYWAHSEDSDQTGRMPRLIWVFVGHSNFVGFVMRRLIFLIIFGVKIVVKYHQFVLKILSGNEILTSIKGHNSVTEWRNHGQPENSIPPRPILRMRVVQNITSSSRRNSNITTCYEMD